jgi:hypothetical protein
LALKIKKEESPLPVAREGEFIGVAISLKS